MSLSLAVAFFKLCGDEVHSLFEFFHLAHLLAEIFLIFLLKILFFLVFIFFGFLLFQQTSAIRNPIVYLFLMKLPNMVLFNAKTILMFSPKIEEIVDIIKFIMCIFDMFFKSLKLEIYLKSLETADVAIGFLIFLRFFFFLSKL
jgi:hypothetical protein